MQVEDDVEDSNNNWEARLDEVPGDSSFATCWWVQKCIPPGKGISWCSLGCDYTVGGNHGSEIRHPPVEAMVVYPIIHRVWDTFISGGWVPLGFLVAINGNVGGLWFIPPHGEASKVSWEISWIQIFGCFLKWWVFPPNHPFVHRVFHLFSPSILKVPQFLGPPQMGWKGSNLQPPT